jgi:hypothetical protein
VKFNTRQKIKYSIFSRHKGGHGIHSPFLFSLITRVIENKGKFSAYPLLSSAEENVRNMLRILDMKFYHSDSRAESGFSVQELKTLHLLPARHDRLLFRLVNEFKPGGVNYYGSTFGVTLLALAMADKRIQVNAMILNDHYLSFCRRLAEVYEIGNLNLTGSGIVEVSEFVVIQNPLDPSYCEQILSVVFAREDFEGVVVLCRIHVSSEMEAVWTKFQQKKSVRISLDLFDIGIFICLKGLQKENFVLRF